MKLIRYDKSVYEEYEGAEALNQNPSENITDWLQVDITDEEAFEAVCKHYNIHQLIVEDIKSKGHLPKFEVLESENAIFFSSKELMVGLDDTMGIEGRGFSAILRSDLLITFHEGYSPSSMRLEAKLKRSDKLLRNWKHNLLLVLLIGAQMDHYLKCLEAVREGVDDLEEEVLERKVPDFNRRFIHLKKLNNYMRKQILPLQEVFMMIKKEIAFRAKNPKASSYWQDVQEQLAHINNICSGNNDMLSSIFDIQQTQINNEINQVMKTLTIVSTIFIPLTFIAGIYGMNFDAMPQLHNPLGYPVVLGVMIFIALIMTWNIRRRGWF